MRKARAALAAAVTVSILGLAPLDAEAAPAGVVINEIESQAGSPDDWVELYNPGGEQVDLGPEFHNCS